MNRVMDSLSSPIQAVEYNCFYAMDKALYSLLATELRRNPHESAHILALWIWWERLGYKNIVQSILALPRVMINDLADEASACLKCIKDPLFLLSGKGFDIPLTRRLLKKKISLQKIFENREYVAEGVSKVIAEVCATALADVIQPAIKRHTEHNAVTCQKKLLPAFEQSIAQSFSSLGFVEEMPNVRSRGRRVPPHNFSNSGRSGGMHRGSGPSNSQVPPEDSTLFVTFSKGYPVEESEVREFFNNLFGDCIVSFFMQPMMPDEQALYARVVFTTPAIVNAILNGLRKAKYTINGKHLWMRKYVVKHGTFHPSQFQAPRQ